jgi:hypothetical protein
MKERSKIMAFSIQQATAVNTLLGYLMGDPHPEYGPQRTITTEEAKKAAMVLADHANKALAAGWHPALVEKRWDEAVQRVRSQKRFTLPDVGGELADPEFTKSASTAEYLQKIRGGRDGGNL